MTTDGVDSLDDLTAEVDDEFASHSETDVRVLATL